MFLSKKGEGVPVGYGLGGANSEAVGVSTARFNYSVCQPVILDIFGLFVFSLTGKLGSCNLRQGTAEISTNKRINYDRPKGYVVCSWRFCCFQNMHSLYNLFPQQLYAFASIVGGLVTLVSG